MAIAGTDSRNIGQQQRQFQKEELRAAVRALLMTPLMSPDDDDFPAVRRQADALRDWFGRETGWMLQIEHEGARLYKRPADLASTTRGLPFYDRRRYVLLCLACAVLERADPADAFVSNQFERSAIRQLAGELKPPNADTGAHPVAHSHKEHCLLLIAQFAESNHTRATRFPLPGAKLNAAESVAGNCDHVVVWRSRSTRAFF